MHDRINYSLWAYIIFNSPCMRMRRSYLVAVTKVYSSVSEALVKVLFHGIGLYQQLLHSELTTTHKPDEFSLRLLSFLFCLVKS